MKRRTFIGGLVVPAAASLSGCVDRPGRYGGWLIALSAFSRPDDATAVPRDDGRIATVTLIQTALDTIGEEQRVSPETYRSLSSVLADLPYYEADREDPSMAGYYVEDPAVEYWPVLRLIPECRESLSSWVINERDGRHAPTPCWRDA